jgi:hypothetical protein
VITLDLIINYMEPLLFVLLGLPLVIQDIRANSVSISFLAIAFSLWYFFPFIVGQGTMGHSVLAALVLLIGALLVLLLPDRFGAADVVFISGMAAIFPYYSFVIAVALGCVGGVVAFIFLYVKGKDDAFTSPLPFLPSLYWGGLTVIIGGLHW